MSRSAAARTGISALLGTVLAGLILLPVEYCYFQGTCRETEPVSDAEGTDSPQPTGSPNEAEEPAGPTTPLEPTSSRARVASIDWELPPGETCNATRYVVFGELAEAPPPGTTLWLIARVLTNPALNVPRPISFAKMELPARAGPFEATVEMPGDGARRPGHQRIFMLFMADAAAHQELQRNYEGDRLQDDSYSDTARTKPLLGAQELAATPVVEQTC